MKKLVVLGANSDIAKATALRFAKAGYTLVLASRNTTELTTFVKQHQLEAEVIFFDAHSSNSRLEIAQKHGKTTDVLLVAFGWLGNNSRAFEEEEERQTILSTNFTAAVEAVQLFAQIFQEKQDGHIIAISSVAGERGKQSTLFYSAAKAGFSAYLSGLRNFVYPQNVHVLEVIPGYVNSKMIAHLTTPAWLTATPEQVASKIYWAHQKKRNSIRINFWWNPIMLVIRSIPESIFKKLKL